MYKMQVKRLLNINPKKINGIECCWQLQHSVPHLLVNYLTESSALNHTSTAISAFRELEKLRYYGRKTIKIYRTRYFHYKTMRISSCSNPVGILIFLRSIDVYFNQFLALNSINTIKEISSVIKPNVKMVA